jgi:hypothetical protein
VRGSTGLWMRIRLTAPGVALGVTDFAPLQIMHVVHSMHLCTRILGVLPCFKSYPADRGFDGPSLPGRRFSVSRWWHALVNGMRAFCSLLADKAPLCRRSVLCCPSTAFA